MQVLEIAAAATTSKEENYSVLTRCSDAGCVYSEFADISTVRVKETLKLICQACIFVHAVRSSTRVMSNVRHVMLANLFVIVYSVFVPAQCMHNIRVYKRSAARTYQCDVTADVTELDEWMD